MGYLDEKAVVVTGAGRGIGRAYAHLAAHEGAAVVVNDIDAEVAEEVTEEIRSAGGRVATVAADVSDWAGAASIIDRCVDEFGAIHGLVNNAGLFAMADGWELTQSHVLELVRANIVGVAACGTFAMRRMVDQGFGSIVNIVSGAHFGIPHMSVYGATKGAVASFTYGWALDLEGTGVRVNAVSPLGRTRMGAATAEFYRSHGLGVIDNAGSPDPEVNAPVVSICSRMRPRLSTAKSCASKEPTWPWWPTRPCASQSSTATGRWPMLIKPSLTPSRTTRCRWEWGRSCGPSTSQAPPPSGTERQSVNCRSG